MSCTFQELCGVEDNALVIMGRLEFENGPALKADISAISFTVTTADDNATQTGTGSLVVANVIYDTLQLTLRWTTDSRGYNFKTTIPASCFPEGDALYEVLFVFTPSNGGDDVKAGVPVRTASLFGS